MKTFRKLFIASFVMTLCLFAACDTDDLKDDIAILKNRVENLEAYVNNMNKNIEALQAFIEGGKTIQSCNEVPREDGTIDYVLTLSDGKVITLNQGVKGTVQYPPISIDEDGYWLIDGVRQEGGKAIGDNAVTPKFRVSEDGFWQINVKGTDNSGDYEFVYEPDGVTKVPARADAEDGGEIKDLFDDVRREGDFFYVKLADGSEFSLPIVEGLSAVIEKPADGRWVEEDGEWMVATGGSSTKVVIKGDQYKHFVIAPVGWKAEISDIDSEGNATLTVVPPVQSITTRASADNTTEVVLQVNKGLYWAVDKIRVKAGNPQTLLERYNAGKDIIIDGLVVNKVTYGEAAHVTTEAHGKVADDKYVYFVEPDATLEWHGNKPKTKDGRNVVIIIGSDENRSAKLEAVKATDWVGWDLYYNGNDNINNPLFIMKNITIVENKQFIFQNIGTVEIIIENCLLNLNRKMADFGSGKTLKTLSIKNSTVNLNGNISICEKAQGTMETSLKLENNIFYSTKPERGELLIGSFSGATLKTVLLRNNVFMNLWLRGDAALVKAEEVKELECSKNLFYDFSRPSGNNAVFGLDVFPEVAGTQWEDNIYFTSDGSKKFTPIYPVPEETACEFKYNFTSPDTPFESINLVEGTYVLLPAYSSYGPQKY
ncbi:MULTISPECIES: PL29 family lyase N-terminal domain-containing protein [Bacteroides]|jgi:negative regulator of replication initiation|uniref:DUF4988 domain-containing protein n=1 Tax=Bacteroides difficilis TaxID=2763021 RepID=A0ABR7C6D1_9BACE|nr:MULTISPECIES: PL29 family lyase N-terminal domain-containing protein [Bacteroides]MBC5603354.1 hypothetical protein [Bacteroides difficilis]